MIIKIYDRYNLGVLNIIEVDLTKEKLIELKKEFKTYLNKALDSGEPLDADNEELFTFIESKGYTIKHIVIDEEIDL
jgi:hypothetical protein